MTDEALFQRILASVSRPTRYIGGEWNQVVKDHRGVDLTFALAYPDVYEIGMSHLGFRILYSLLNAREDTAAERVSVDRRDNRRGTAVDRVEHPPERCRVGDVRLAVEVGRRAHPSDVRTRTEARPVARQNDRTGGADVDERLRELGDQGGVESVPRLRPCERDPEDVVVAFDPQRTHGREPMVCAVPANRFTVELERVRRQSLR